MRTDRAGPVRRAARPLRQARSTPTSCTRALRDGAAHPAGGPCRDLGGGVLGTAARYGVGRAIHVTPGTFPWATFTVNISGSFVLGVLLTLCIERWPPSRYVRPFVAIGFLGSYTTFST